MAKENATASILESASHQNAKQRLRAAVAPTACTSVHIVSVKTFHILSCNAGTTSETEVKSDLEFRPAAKQANRARLTFPQGSGTPQRERKCLVRGPNTMHELYRDRRPRGRDPQTLTQWSVPQRLSNLHKDLSPQLGAGRQSMSKRHTHTCGTRSRPP